MRGHSAHSGLALLCAGRHRGSGWAEMHLGSPETAWKRDTRTSRSGEGHAQPALPAQPALAAPGTCVLGPRHSLT